MAHKEDNDNLFQTLYNNLQPGYSISTNEDLIKTMIEVGIPEEETSIIARIFDLLGSNSFIDVEGATIEKEYEIQFHEPPEGYLTLSKDELFTEIEILRIEMESATDESQRVSCLRRIAEISGRLATIKVSYQSEEEVHEKKKRLSAYIRIAREIIDRC